MSKRIGFLFLALAFCSHSSLAAGIFSDVPTDSWYAPYVDRLVNEGVIDAGLNFRPADSLNRAELVKMVITVIDGLKDYSEPPTATFDDVPKDAWFYKYVEQAATMDIVTGYSDEEGNLIGLFGPGDTVTRAAAVKILTEAFDLDSTASDPAVFKDVQSGDWFKSYVEIASQNGVVAGYSNGNFGPADPVTRAQMAKMIALSAEATGLWEPVQPDEPDLPEPEEEGPPLIEEPTVPDETAPQAEANPAMVETMIAPAGAAEQLVAKYTFKAIHEGFRVETITIVNDITGAKLGDELAGTPAIKNVILKFPDKDGKAVTESSSLGSDGKARFANLEFFAKRDAETFFEVYAELNRFADVGENLSGEVFRLGIQNAGNTSGSFRAVGDISDWVISGVGSGGDLQLSNSQIQPFTVRKSAPSFSLNPSAGPLTEGSNTLISFNVAADPAGSVALARIVFDVSVDDNAGGDLSVGEFRLYRGSSPIDAVGIYDATGGQDLTPMGGGTLTDGLSFVIVTFFQEETISKGETRTYSLRAAVSQSDNDDSLSSRISTGDDDTALTGLTFTGQPNTGKIFVNGDPTAGIFTGANDFFQSLGSSRDIIWSDKSAELHLYPTISAGVITSDSGSADWTNGYLLHAGALETYTLSQ